MVCALQNIALLCDAVRDSASAAGLGVASCASGSDRNVHVTLITFGGSAISRERLRVVSVHGARCR